MDENNQELHFQSTGPSLTEPPPKPSLMVRLLMKYSGGKIKDERQANIILTIVAVVLILVSLYFFF